MGPFEAQPNDESGAQEKILKRTLLVRLQVKKPNCFVGKYGNMANKIKVGGGGAWNEVISLVGEFKEKTDACGEVL